MQCEAINQSTKECCSSEATHLVSFAGDDKSPTCGDCAMQLQQLAQEHHTQLRVERIDAK